MAVRTINKRSAKHNGSKGFTLVEMIVVLVILSILASVGVFTAIGYYRKSVYDKNQSNAGVVYRAAQSALQEKEKSGQIDEWAKGVKTNGTAFEYSSSDSNSTGTTIEKKFDESDFNAFPKADTKPNESVHMRYILKYKANTPDSKQSKAVKALIEKFFYDPSIFKGAITLEIDVEKTIDAYRNEHYSAKCLSVFVDSRTKGDWSDKAYTDDENPTLPSTWVPNRSESYRRNKSLIGYHKGYTGTSVDTVYLPKLREIKVDKFVLEYSIEPVETPDPGEGGGSGEGSGGNSGEGGTGEGEDEPEQTVTYTWLTWSASVDRDGTDKCLNGHKEDVWYRIALLSGNNTKKVLILNEDFLLSGDSVGDAKHSIDYLNLIKDKGDKETVSVNGSDVTVTVETYPVVYDGYTKDITKKSITLTGKVFVASSESDGYMDKKGSDMSFIEIPVKITYVMNDYSESATEPKSYIEYSINVSKATSEYTSDIDGAVLKIYPNHFTKESMKAINDVTDITPFKKGRKLEIDQSEVPTSNP